MAYKKQGASLTVEAVVLKVVTRNSEGYTLYTESIQKSRPMQAFAHFSNSQEIERVKALKLRKGSRVKITGKFQALGEKALNMNDCRLIN